MVFKQQHGVVHLLHISMSELLVDSPLRKGGWDRGPLTPGQTVTSAVYTPYILW